MPCRQTNAGVRGVWREISLEDGILERSACSNIPPENATQEPAMNGKYLERAANVPPAGGRDGRGTMITAAADMTAAANVATRVAKPEPHAASAQIPEQKTSVNQNSGRRRKKEEVLFLIHWLKCSGAFPGASSLSSSAATLEIMVEGTGMI